MLFWIVMAILNIIHQFLTGIGMTAAFVIYPVFVSFICEEGDDDEHYDYEDFGKSETEFYGENYSSGANCSGYGIFSWSTRVVDKFLWVYLAIGSMVITSLCLGLIFDSIKEILCNIT